MSNLFDSISTYLQNKGFVVGTNEKESITFSKEFEAPRRQVIVNGQKLVEPVHKVNFVITCLGQGKMYNAGDEEEELQGYNMADNDIWVSSLDDFKFWMHRIFE